MIILAEVHDDGRLWPIVSIFGFIAVVSLVSAFFPNWKVTWGSRHSRGIVPMSILGRVAFGSTAAWMAITAAINSRAMDYLVMPVYVLLLIATGFVAYRDNRNYKKTLGDQREEN